VYVGKLACMSIMTGPSFAGPEWIKVVAKLRLRFDKNFVYYPKSCMIFWYVRILRRS